MKQLVFLYFALLSFVLQAQYTSKGLILDKETNKPLAFVNISYETDKLYGTTSDIDGKYVINSNTKPLQFHFSYVGYKSLTLQPHQLRDTLYMEVESDMLAAVTLNASYNPAHRIIKKAVANKKQNNPNRLKSYQFHSYNKLIVDFLIEEKEQKAEKTDSSKTDSTGYKLREYFSKKHVAVMESVNRKRYISPETHEEEVIGSKVSGLSDPRFGIVITDFQPFSFYEDMIPLMGIEYLNPISKGSLSRYDFQLEESLVQENDTVFVISYKPAETSNIEGMRGVLSIHSDGYAIQNVIAEPADPSLYKIRIEQLYQKQEQLQWFPVQINYTIEALSYPSETMRLLYNGRSYIKDIKINPDFNEKLNIESLLVREGAGQQDSLFWKQHRTEVLRSKETATYHHLDSLGKKYKFDLLYNLGEQIGLGRIPLGPVDINTNKFGGYNEHEGSRIGLGMHTSRKLFKHAIVGGYWAYGFRDEEHKFGTDIEFFLHDPSELRLKLEHSEDVKEPGRLDLPYPATEVNLHSILIEKMDRLKETKLSLGFRAFRYATFKLSMAQQELDILHDYEWVGQPQNNLNFAEFGFQARYAPKEKIVSIAGERLAYRTDYPIFFASYNKGFDNVLDGNYNYEKLVLAVDYNFRLRNIGRSDVRIEFGKFWGDAPISKQFFANGSYLKGRSIVIPKSFQTMGLYEFASDRFFQLYFSHNFGTLLYKSPKHIAKYFDPEITLVHNIAWGDHPNNDQHILPEDVKLMNKWYLEGGLQLDHLLKVNMLNAVYLGVGAGIFGRYGAYAHPEFMDNIVAKLSLKASI